MKKLLYLIAALPIVACTNTSYKISGSTQNVSDSSIVFLQVYKSDKSIETIDTAYVVNNSFNFKGPWTEGALNAQLAFKSYSFNPKLILEKGSIDIEIKDFDTHDYTLKGTHNNEEYSKLYNANKDFNIKSIGISKEIATATTTENINELYNQALEIQTTINKTFINYAIENPNKDLSSLIIEDLYFRNGITLDELNKFESILDKNNKNYAKIAAYKDGRLLSTQIDKTFDIDPFTSLAHNHEDYKSVFGDKTIIYFWNSYDTKNEENFHALQLIYDKYKGEVPVITFNIGRNQDKYKAFIKNHHQFINFNISETNSPILKDLLKKYNLKFLPQGILTDKNGKILDMDPTLDYILEPLHQNL